jgi:hypothetical protein
MAVGDPAKSLAAATQKWKLWVSTMIIGLLATGFAVPFVVGVATRLRDAAPTRARAALYITLIGLAGYAMSSTVGWFGGTQVVQYAAKDQTAATHAWLAMSAVNASLSSLGSAFTGAGAAIAGWAIISTKSMSAGVGWVGVVAGVLSVLALFATSSMLIGFLGFLLIIVWIAWAGAELRRA